MTIFWTRRTRVIYGVIEKSSDCATEAPEFDDEGRRYVFRYASAPRQRYHVDRDRIFDYLATHELPGIRARSIRRDTRNAANFFEDVRELQTHPDIVEIRRLRSAS
jgi:hypothetical protein